MTVETEVVVEIIISVFQASISVHFGRRVDGLFSLISSIFYIIVNVGPSRIFAALLLSSVFLFIVIVIDFNILIIFASGAERHFRRAHELVFMR